MGSKLWHHVSSNFNSPLDALHEIQSRVEAETDLPGLIQSRLESTRNAVLACERHDEYGLLTYYRDELEKIHDIAEAPLPQSIKDRIRIIRRIHDSCGEGVGNVLDVTDVSNTGGTHVTRPCDGDELHRLVGSNSPTITEARMAIGQIHEQLSRGESLCFRVFSEDRRTSLGWFFIGNTID